MSELVDVVRASDDDLGSLAALRYQWRVDEGDEHGEGYDTFEVRFRAWYEAHRRTHVGFLAIASGEAIGCAWLFVIDRVPGPERFIRRAGMLQSVYVVPSRRNQGVGERLIRHLIDEAKDRELDYLMVHPSSASFPFYRRLGFAESNRVLELRFA